jgi:hypothetical protein
VGIGNERKDDQKIEEESHPEFDKTRLEDLFIFYVIFFEITAPHVLLPFFGL